MEERCKALERKVAELSRTVAEQRSSSASPRLGVTGGAESGDSAVDPLMVLLSWAESLERNAADVALRSVLAGFLPCPYLPQKVCESGFIAC